MKWKSTSAGGDAAKVFKQPSHPLSAKGATQMKMQAEVITPMPSDKKSSLRVQPNMSSETKDWEARLHKNVLQEGLSPVDHHQVVDQVIDLLHSRLEHENPDTMSKAVLHEELKKYGCFYAKYKEVVIAAMIVIREDFSYDGRDAMFITHIAVKQNFDGFGFGWFLLHKFAQNVLKHVDAYIFAYVTASEIKYFEYMSRLPLQQDHIFKLKQRKRATGFFAHCGFSFDEPRQEDNFNLSKEAAVPPNTLVMRATSSFLQDYLSHTKAPLETKFLDINPNMFDEIMYIKATKALKVYNIHFGWKTVQSNSLVGVSQKEITWCQNNPGKVRKLRSGLRNTSMASTSESDAVDQIPSVFQGRNSTSGDCVWKAAALLIRKESLANALEMIHQLHKYKSYFEWTSFFSAQNEAVGIKDSSMRNVNSLASALSFYTSYECHRFRGVLPSHRIQHLIAEERQRMAVVELKDQNGGRHAVGVDCTRNPKIIWDCQEKHGLVLTKNNLDYCCGPHCECVEITNIATIIKKRGKK